MWAVTNFALGRFRPRRMSTWISLLCCYDIYFIYWHNPFASIYRVAKLHVGPGVPPESLLIYKVQWSVLPKGKKKTKEGNPYGITSLLLSLPSSGITLQYSGIPQVRVACSSLRNFLEIWGWGQSLGRIQPEKRKVLSRDMIWQRPLSKAVSFKAYVCRDQSAATATFSTRHMRVHSVKFPVTCKTHYRQLTTINQPWNIALR